MILLDTCKSVVYLSFIDALSPEDKRHFNQKKQEKKEKKGKKRREGKQCQT